MDFSSGEVVWWCGFGRWCSPRWPRQCLSSLMFFCVMILPLFDKSVEFGHPPLEAGPP